MQFRIKLQLLLTPLTHATCFAGLIAWLLLLGSCTATTESIRVDGCIAKLPIKQDTPSPASLLCQQGVQYSLPKAQVTLSASRQRIPISDPRADLETAKALLASTDDASQIATLTSIIAALSAIVSAQNDVTDQTTQVTLDANAVTIAQTIFTSELGAKSSAPGSSGPGSSAPTGVSSAQLQADRNTLWTAQSTLLNDQKRLNQLTSDLSTKLDEFPKWQETVSLTLIPAVPDPTARYITNLRHKVTRDDNWTVNVSNGLLNSLSSTSTDQTPNLIVSLADTAISIAAYGGGASGAIKVAPSALATAQPALDCNYALVQVFNPLDPNDLDKLHATLLKVESNIDVDIDYGQIPADASLLPPNVTSGLVYRIATPIVIRAAARTGADLLTAKCPLNTLPTAQSIMAVIPDSRSQYVIESIAGPFTTTSLSFGFSNGMLTNYTATRPSELAAIGNIPTRIGQDLLQIPTQIIQAKVNYDTQATALVNAQTAYQQAQLSRPTTLTNSQAALVNAQTALQQAQLNQPVAVVNGQTALVTAQTSFQQAQAAQPTAAVNSQIALANANTALQQAQAGSGIALLTSQTAMANAEAALQQATIGASTAETTARTALVNAYTAYQQALSNQPTATTNSQTSLIQAHAALLQAEQALRKLIGAGNSQ